MSDMVPASVSTMDRIAEEYAAPLWRLTGGYAVPHSDREDLLQEILRALCRSCGSFRGECSERTWIYRVAHNVAVSWSLGRTRRERVEVAETDLRERAAEGATPEAEALDRERRALLADAVRALEGLDRQVLISHLEGLSNVEIAAVSGLTEGAIAVRLTRLRARLTKAVTGGRNVSR